MMLLAAAVIALGVIDAALIVVVIFLISKISVMEARMSAFDDAVAGLNSDLVTLKAQVDGVAAGSVPIAAATAAVNGARSQVQSISAELPPATPTPAPSA